MRNTLRKGHLSLTSDGDKEDGMCLNAEKRVESEPRTSKVHEQLRSVVQECIEGPDMREVNSQPMHEAKPKASKIEIGKSLTGIAALSSKYLHWIPLD